jgi:hypothetical protein
MLPLLWNPEFITGMKNASRPAGVASSALIDRIDHISYRTIDSGVHQNFHHTRQLGRPKYLHLSAKRLSIDMETIAAQYLDGSVEFIHNEPQHRILRHIRGRQPAAIGVF